MSDELYPSEGLGDITFRLTQGGVGTTMVSTDENGQLILTDLEKNTTYRLRQLESADNYQFSDADFVFSVSADGRVEEEAQKSYVITNRLIRAEISVVDRVLRSHVSNFNVALYDSQDQLVGVWDSTALARSLEGLEPGIYYLVLNGKTEKRQAIEIQDTAEIQIINVPVWTTVGVGILGLVAALVLGLAAFLIRRRQRRGPSDLPPPSVELIAAVSRAGAAQTAAETAPEASGSEPQPDATPDAEPESPSAEPEAAPVPESADKPEDEPAQTESQLVTASVQAETAAAGTETAPGAPPAEPDTAPEAGSSEPATEPAAEPAPAEPAPEAESAQTEPAPEAAPVQTETASETAAAGPAAAPESTPAARTETRRPRGGSHAKPRRSWWKRDSK